MIELCVVCGGRSHSASNLAHGLVQCRTCSLIFLPAAIERGDEFGSSYYVGGAYADYAADRGAIVRSSVDRLKKIEAIAGGRRLLDVGCASGYFLECARGRGWEVTGLELSTFASERARQLNLTVHVASVLDPPTMPPFDVVTMWDTIEHIARPDIALQNVRALLQPEGVLALSTGDCSSLFARACGRRWRLLSDPTHKFFFSRATLTRLIEQAGFHLVAAAYPGKWVSVAMGLHQLPVPGSRLLRRVAARARVNPAVYVNLRDVITIIAAKN